MAFDIVREDVKTSFTAGRESIQTIIEENIIVPDTKPDISKVLLVDGDVFITDTQAQADKVAIEGVIRYKVLYVSEDSDIKGITTDAVFDYEIEVSGAQPNMICNVKCGIEHIEYEVSNSRKLSLKTILSAECLVRGETVYNLITDIDGIEDLQYLRKSQSFDSYLGLNKEAFTLNESLEIPAGKPSIYEILRADVRLNGKEFSVTDNKVIVKGEVNIETLYVSDEEEQRIQYMEHELPFTQIIDFDGVNENTRLITDCKIVGSGVTAEEDIDGELRLLKVQIDLEVLTEGFEPFEVEVISDTFSPTRSIQLEKNELVLEEIAVLATSQESVKELIEIDRENPPITEILNVVAIPILSDYSLSTDRVNIEGVVKTNILYLSDAVDQPVYCARKDIPFRKSLDVSGLSEENECDVNLDVGYCNFSLDSSGKVDLRMTLGVEVRARNERTISIISDVEETEEATTRGVYQPSVLIYFAKQGDSLWNIAKKYRTTIQDIESINDIDDESTIRAGQQVIIPRKV